MKHSSTCNRKALSDVSFKFNCCYFNCGYRANRRHDMVVHVRRHSGERPHLCLLCGCSFHNSSVLSKHIRTHTGERPHQCTFCDHASNSSSDLRRHIRSRHVWMSIKYSSFHMDILLPVCLKSLWISNLNNMQVYLCTNPFCDHASNSSL